MNYPRVCIVGGSFDVAVAVHEGAQVRFSSMHRWLVCRQQGRDLLASQVRPEARAEIVQHVALLLAAGGHHRQHPLHELAASGTVRPPSDPPPDQGMPQRAFRRVVRRLHPFDAHEGSQTLLYLEDLEARRRRLGAAATLAAFQRSLDLAPQPRRNRLEPLPINGSIADAVPPAKHPLGQTQEGAPGRLPSNPTVDHRLEIPIQVRPADLPPRRMDPLDRTVPVAGDNLIRLAPQQRLDHRSGSFGCDGEDCCQRGDDHPQLGLVAVFTPRGIVDAGRRGVVDAHRHFVVRGFRHRGRLPLELGDHTRGEGQAKQITDRLPDLALAEAVAASDRGQHRLQIRAETSPGNPCGETPTGGYAALGAGQVMKPEFVDQRLELGQFGDLVYQGGRVITDQGMATAPAIRGPAIGNRANFSGGTKRPWALRCPGCPPRFRPEGGAAGLRLNPMGSDEGGLEELVELSFSRASRSLTRCSSSATRPLTESKTARRAIWASGGTVFQSGSGMGG